jgi:DNA-binding response OmpR family regulator
MKVLIAEDDQFTRAGLAELLEHEGYSVVEAADGRQALELFDRHRPEIVCLDVMMPEIDGFDVCRRLRAQGEHVPILFISAKGEEIDKVVGLELGGDDFITKPFGIKEVVARIRAVTRRYLATADRGDEHEPGKRPFTIGDLRVVPDELRAYRDRTAIDLSLREVCLLTLFAANPGRVLDRNTILNACWGVDYLPSSRTLDQHISQLRKRVEHEPGRPCIITTVHGVGYRWDPETR